MVMVAVAVSQVKVNPHQEGTFREVKGVAVEAQIGDPLNKKPKKQRCIEFLNLP
jgi:hypothetical protein